MLSSAVGVALALALFALVRSVPAVLVVRTFLRLAKGAVAERGLALGVATVALVAPFVVVAAGGAPIVAGLPGVVLFARALWLLGPGRPAWPARRIGMMEAVLGLFYVGTLAVAFPY